MSNGFGLPEGYNTTEVKPLEEYDPVETPSGFSISTSAPAQVGNAMAAAYSQALETKVVEKSGKGFVRRRLWVDARDGRNIRIDCYSDKISVGGNAAGTASVAEVEGLVAEFDDGALVRPW